jgi:hypothetical protein
LQYTVGPDEPDMKKRKRVWLQFMKNRLEIAAPRRLVCSLCGTQFTCSLDASCWCAKEAARMPMPLEGADCLCRECLRKMAAEAINIRSA